MRRSSGPFSPGPPLLEIGTNDDSVDVEVRNGAHDLVQADEIEAGSRSWSDCLAGGQSLGEKDRRDARDIGSMHLTGDHENANLQRQTVRTHSLEEHVKAALVGTEAVEQEGQFQKPFCVGRQ